MLWQCSTTTTKHHGLLHADQYLLAVMNCWQQWQSPWCTLTPHPSGHTVIPSYVRWHVGLYAGSLWDTGSCLREKDLYIAMACCFPCRQSLEYKNMLKGKRLLHNKFQQAPANIVHEPDILAYIGHIGSTHVNKSCFVSNEIPALQSP